MEDAVMAKLLVTDDLWLLIEPLIPKRRPSPRGGQPPKDDRLCLTGILFVLKTGIGWEDFPQEMGCCGMTLWNRLNAWRKAGLWKRLHAVLLAKLHEADLIDWSRATADSASVRAVRGGKKRAPTPWTAARTARSITC
jgi:transposase